MSPPFRNAAALKMSPSSSTKPTTAEIPLVALAIDFSCAMLSRTNEGLRTRSSGGYPVSTSSGKQTMSAPAFLAFSIHSSTRRVLPSRSPTVGLTCASAILTRQLCPSRGWPKKARPNPPGMGENAIRHEAGPLLRGRCAHLRLRHFLLALAADRAGSGAVRSAPAPLAERRGGADPAGCVRRGVVWCPVGASRAPGDAKRQPLEVRRGGVRDRSLLHRVRPEQSSDPSWIDRSATFLPRPARSAWRLVRDAAPANRRSLSAPYLWEPEGEKV